MNIINKPKLIKKIADNLRIAEWQVHKAIYELNTGDDKVIIKHFEQNNLESRLKEMLIRVEELHIYLMQSRTIHKDEYSKMNVRVAHLKQDMKSLIEEFSDMQPNFIGVVKEYISNKTEALLLKTVSPQDFLVGLSIIMQDYNKI